MNKFLKAGIAALTLTAVVAGAALPADAQPRRDYRSAPRYYDRDRHNDTGVAIAAGVLGLALGAAIAGNNHSNSGSYYGGSSYSNGYYGNGYGSGSGSGYGSGYYNNGYDSGYGYGSYGRGYDSYYGRTCQRDTRSWDRYGRPVVIRQQYAC